MTARRALVIIPAHNEEASVAGVVTAVRERCDFPVVVIDDASDDRTAERAGRAGARVLSHAVRLGAWGAMQTGLRLAAREGFDSAITMDADGQHEAAALALLMERADGPTVDVVIGACVERGDWARRLAWTIFRRLTGLSVQDLTSGFRLYRRPAIERLVSEEAAFLEYQDVGVLMLLRASGMRVAEVEVPMASRVDGESRIFGSWFSVLRYLSHTLLLSTCKLGRSTARGGGDS